MQRTIISAVLVGLVAGLIVGVYSNIFIVPVLERAIALEEERAAAALPPGAQPDDEPPLVSLGLQRVGALIGWIVMWGALFTGLLFACFYGLLRWTFPNVRPVMAAIITGGLGFWAMVFLPFIKFPPVPPGVGEGDTLVFRQGFQFLMFALSGLGVAALLLALNEIRSSARSESNRRLLYALASAAYAAFILLALLLIPGNPDPVPVPAGLLLQFSALTLVGHLLLWALTAAGFAWLIRRREQAASRH